MKPIAAIVGRPNVGKSTLFNRLVGRRKALTLDQPGVTRDRHYETVSWDGKEFLLVDTGGLVLEKKEGLEKKVRRQIEIALQEANVVLFVLDARVGLTPPENDLIRWIRKTGKPILFILNKVDEPKPSVVPSEFYALSDTVYPISAEHGYGVSDLLDHLISILPISPEESSENKQRPVRIGLIGRPNVGKSSLLNRWVGEERSVVHEEAGTTSDSIDMALRIRNKDYLLVDTAGIRRGGKSASTLERYSVLQALKVIERSDVCFLVLDASEGIHKQDAHIAGVIEKAKKGLILIWNKWDLVKKQGKEKFEEEVQRFLKFVPYAPMIFVSAKTGEGCEEPWKITEKLQEQSGRRLSTRTVNDFLEQFLLTHNPPLYRGRPLKFYYATQASVFPPTFVIFVNQPEGVHFSFQRYLINSFRKSLGFEEVPLRILFRKRS